MDIEDRVKICEALGLDADRVTRIEISITPDFASVRVDIRAQGGKEIEEIVGVLKKYEIKKVSD